MNNQNFKFQGENEFANGWFYKEEGEWYKRICNNLYNAKIIEIGSYEGLSLSYIKDTIKNNNNTIWSVEINPKYKLKNNLKNWGIELINKSSFEASKLFENCYFDLVFIDANHSYENINQDIKVWIPKIKNNGIISGHDYDTFWTGVKKAVDENFNNKLKLGPDRIWWYNIKKIY